MSSSKPCVDDDDDDEGTNKLEVMNFETHVNYVATRLFIRFNLNLICT